MKERHKELGIDIKEMTLEDLDQVMEIEVASFPTPWKRSMFEKDLRMGGRFCIYKSAKIGDKVVGYVGGWVIGDEMHITTIAVASEYRGRGIGDALLSDILEEARERGCRVATLEVRETNWIAQNLYKKHGFLPIGLRRGYYKDTGEDAIVMVLEL